MLGHIATPFPGEPLHYDPMLGRIANKDDANAFVDYTARED